MNIREGVRTSRRYQLRLSAPLAIELEGFADAHALRPGSAIRVLVRRGLDRGEEDRLCRECAAAVAGLIAAEHAVLMVAAVLPEGQRRLRELAPRAAVAAEDRLRLVQESGHE